MSQPQEQLSEGHSVKEGVTWRSVDESALFKEQKVKPVPDVE